MRGMVKSGLEGGDLSASIKSRLPIVVVDDDTRLLRSYRAILESAGFGNVLCFEDGVQALAQVRIHGAELILLDLNMPGLSGSELLPKLVEEFPDTPVIVVTGMDNSLEMAVACIKQGAYDFLTKPIINDVLFVAIRRAMASRQMQVQQRELLHVMDSSLRHPKAFESIATQNERMFTLFRYVEAIAGSSMPVLVTGETGTGKDLLARVLHALSGRPSSLFVTVNIAGLDDQMFSDTLFGHVKGAYSGAHEERAGLVETAGQGTLVLDEIGDLSMASQVKLLRLIQQREYLPLGEDRPRSSLARVVATTHADLVKKRDAGLFRADLYYRLCTHRVHLPPLRERMDDLSLLIDAFLEKGAGLLKKKKPEFDDDLVDLLSGYDFPGNVRELEGMLMDAMSVREAGCLAVDYFTRYLELQRTVGKSAEPSRAANQNMFSSVHPLPTLTHARQLLVDEALKRSNGRQTLAARMLGVTQQALSLQLKKRTMMS